jgi:cobalamin-dependent methionine synthase I
MRVLTLQREAQRVARARTESRVMLATPPGDLHAVALRMVGNLLREAGYDVMMLGADVPIHALAHSARRHEPEVICLSATMPQSTERFLQSIREVRSDAPGVGFVMGGRALNPTIIGRLRSEPRLHLCTRRLGGRGSGRRARQEGRP